MALPPEVSARIEAIRRNRTSGAAALAAEAAEALALAAQRAPERLEEAARELVAAQPAMATIVNLADFVTRSPDPLAACREFTARLRDSLGRVAANAAALIPEGGTVMTHSSSATVLESFRAARRAGRQFSVICTESQPGGEGVAFAAAISGEGIPARVIPDAEIGLWLPRVQLVLVGGDSVSPAGVVNKVGTARLAEAARARDVPVYALCGSEKFVRAPLPRQDRFDTTPLDRFTAIVTEK